MSGSFFSPGTDEPANCDSTFSSNLFVQSAEHSPEQQTEVKYDNYRSLVPSTETDHSFVALLKRLCLYYRRILFNKIRLLCTIIFMSMLNITARITCFVRQRTTPASPIGNSVTSAPLRTLEEDLTDSSKAFRSVENTSSPTVDLPSVTNSKMAHLLVRQQTHRTPNMNIHSSAATQKDSKLPMTHSVDDRLFLRDSTQLLHLLKRFASEPQISKYHPTSATHTNGHFSKPPEVRSYSAPVNNGYVPVTEPDNGEIHFEDLFFFNCDKTQPVSPTSTTTSTSSSEDWNSDKLDELSPMISSEPLATINPDERPLPPQEDALIDLSSFVNSAHTNHPEANGERHFRRRRRRSSLSRSSFSSDDGQLTVDLLAKLEITPSPTKTTAENEENLDVNAKESVQETQTSNNAQTTPSEVANLEEEKSASLSRYRGRRLRHRFYRHAASTTAVDASPTTLPHFFLPNEALNVEAPRALSSPVTNVSPPLSPTSPTLTTDSNACTPTAALTKSSSASGGMKRVGSMGATKKNVRFADSVGRELAQVQYIRSSIVDESKELSFLLGSSPFSSSPPSFFKNNLYVQNSSGLEHKPWSFDVALTATKAKSDTSMPRRFFCLFRQPNSEHPDIYLHEIWRSQIKLEYADISLQVSATGEQQLHGSLWVTNASYWKYVSVKYTFNRWQNTCEHEAQHRCHSNDFRNIDKFEFTIPIPAGVDRVDFVLRYSVNGQDYWDNNDGNNYTLQTDSAYRPATTISLPHDCDFNEMRFY